MNLQEGYWQDLKAIAESEARKKEAKGLHKRSRGSSVAEIAACL